MRAEGSVRARFANGPAVERPSIWTAKEAAIFLGTSADWVYSHACDGTLPGFKIGGRWRFDPPVLRKWYRQQQTPRRATGEGAR